MSVDTGWSHTDEYWTISHPQPINGTLDNGVWENIIDGNMLTGVTITANGDAYNLGTETFSLTIGGTKASENPKFKAVSVSMRTTNYQPIEVWFLLSNGLYYKAFDLSVQVWSYVIPKDLTVLRIDFIGKSSTPNYPVTMEVYEIACAVVVPSHLKYYDGSNVVTISKATSSARALGFCYDADVIWESGHSVIIPYTERLSLVDVGDYRASTIRVYTPEGEKCLETYS